MTLGRFMDMPATDRARVAMDLPGRRSGRGGMRWQRASLDEERDRGPCLMVWCGVSRGRWSAGSAVNRIRRTDRTSMGLASRRLRAN